MIVCESWVEVSIALALAWKLRFALITSEARLHAAEDRPADSLPAASVEDMYAPAVRARTAMGQMNIAP